MEFLVVGCRGFGKYHLDALSKMDVDISIMERDRETVEFCRKNYNIRKVYSDFDDVLSSNAEVIDLVVPHNLHYPMTAKALNAGKHVLVEKPIATTLEDAGSMIRLSEQLKRKLMVTDQYHFDPAVARILDSMARNEIGKVHTIIIRNQRLHLGPEWRNVKEQNGGGALIDGGIHYINTMLNIGGEYSKVISRTYTGNTESKVEDTTMAIFDFKSGVKGLMFYSWAYPGTIDLPSYEILGDNGSIIEDLGSKPKNGFVGRRGMRAYGDPIVNNRLLQVGEYDVFVAEMQGFKESVERDEDVPFSPNDAARDLKAVLEIYKGSE